MQEFRKIRIAAYLYVNSATELESGRLRYLSSTCRACNEVRAAVSGLGGDGYIAVVIVMTDGLSSSQVTMSIRVT